MRLHGSWVVGLSPSYTKDVPWIRQLCWKRFRFWVKQILDVKNKLIELSSLRLRSYSGIPSIQATHYEVVGIKDPLCDLVQNTSLTSYVICHMSATTFCRQLIRSGTFWSTMFYIRCCCSVPMNALRHTQSPALKIFKTQEIFRTCVTLLNFEVGPDECKRDLLILIIF